MFLDKIRWKLARALALGIVAVVLSASSQVSKVNACIGCQQSCNGNQTSCQSVCTEGAGNFQQCSTPNNICQPFGNCGGGGGGGGIGGLGC
jgi:hypothetical protein